MVARFQRAISGDAYPRRRGSAGRLPRAGAKTNKLSSLCDAVSLHKFFYFIWNIFRADQRLRFPQRRKANNTVFRKEATQAFPEWKLLIWMFPVNFCKSGQQNSVEKTAVFNGGIPGKGIRLIIQTLFRSRSHDFAIFSRIIIKNVFRREKTLFEDRMDLFAETKKFLRFRKPYPTLLCS
jgi:hypothetical protein